MTKETPGLPGLMSLVKYRLEKDGVTRRRNVNRHAMRRREPLAIIQFRVIGSPESKRWIRCSPVCDKHVDVRSPMLPRSCCRRILDTPSEAMGGQLDTMAGGELFARISR